MLSKSRQVSESHRGGTHKIGFLRHALVAYELAKKPLSRVATTGLSYQNFYAELNIAAHLEQRKCSSSCIDESIQWPDYSSGQHTTNKLRRERTFVRDSWKKQKIWRSQTKMFRFWISIAPGEKLSGSCKL